MAVVLTDAQGQRVRAEAGDVVWTTAMLADLCGALRVEETAEYTIPQALRILAERAEVTR